MSEIQWGLLGPGQLGSTRRTRTLGLGRAIRRFNECAVPGLGGLWFGRQVLLTALSMEVAERAAERGVRCSNIEMANAIEAIACIIGYDNNKWTADSRLRGRTKLPRDEVPQFSSARQRRFHVVQPMRMSTAQALPSLGLAIADGSRYNAFESNDLARSFIAASLDDASVGKSTVIEHLVRWADGGSLSMKSAGLRSALDPTLALPTSACKLLHRALLDGGNLGAVERLRRNNAWTWVTRLAQMPPSRAGSMASTSCPAELDADHWADLRAGAQLLVVRDAAEAVLDAVERILGQRQGQASLSLGSALPVEVVRLLQVVEEQACAFLALQHHDAEANAFCHECASGGVAELRSLLARDGHVLRLSGDCARPGPAYTGNPPPVRHAADELAGEESGMADARYPLPDDCSYRLKNLYLLQLDLNGKLAAWLAPAQEEIEEVAA